MTLTTTTVQQIGQEYDRKVEELLKENDLARYLGTDMLNPVQMEVNRFNQFLEQAFATKSTSMSSVNNEINKSMSNLRQIVKTIQKNRFESSNLGSISNQMNIMDSPAWSAVLSDVAMKIDEIGSQYGQVIVNQPDKVQIDKGMASALEMVESAFAVNPSPGSANNTRNSAMGVLSQIETMLAQRKGKLAQASLTTLIAQKEMEMLNTISVLKMHESDLSDSEKSVVQMHMLKATEHLASMKGNPSSYDKAILRQNLNLFDTILAPLVQMRESVQYRSALSGGNFSSPRRPSLKTHGFGSVPKRRYHESQTSRPVNRSPFRVAPNVAGVRGFGSVTGDSVATQMEKVDETNTPPEDIDGVIADTLDSNLEIAAAQGFVSPADEAILREQLSRLNVSAFGGDQDLYMSSKTAIKNTIDHYAEIYYNKVASGEIDANLPPNYNKDTGQKYPEGFRPVNSFISRLGVTLGVGTAAFALLSLGIAYKIATKGTTKS